MTRLIRAMCSLNTMQGSDLYYELKGFALHNMTVIWRLARDHDLAIYHVHLPFKKFMEQSIFEP